jgi:hypothetical protein
MVISSRTPEGEPFFCVICDRLVVVEGSPPDGDSLCPSCGRLLWRIRGRLGHIAAFWLEAKLDADLRAEMDSLDIQELVLELGEDLDVNLSDRDLQGVRTLEDLLRVVLRLQRERDEKELD